nr:Argininosuccinate synthase [Escherichia coli]
MTTILKHLPVGQRIGIAFFWRSGHQCRTAVDATKGSGSLCIYCKLGQPDEEDYDAILVVPWNTARRTHV